MKLETVFRNINFTERYQSICENHNDFENSMSGNYRKAYSDIIRKINSSAHYRSKDKMFQVNFSYNEHSLNLGLSVDNGLVEARLFYIKEDEWLIYNRFDFISEELDSNFNREIYNNPKYSTLEELEDILRDIFRLYEDFKTAFIEHLKKSEFN